MYFSVVVRGLTISVLFLVVQNVCSAASSSTALQPQAKIEGGAQNLVGLGREDVLTTDGDDDLLKRGHQIMQNDQADLDESIHAWLDLDCDSGDHITLLKTSAFQENLSARMALCVLLIRKSTSSSSECFDEAVALANTLTDNDEVAQRAHFFLGALYKRASDQNKAVEHYTQSVNLGLLGNGDIDWESVKSAYKLGKIFYRQRRFDEVKRYLEYATDFRIRHGKSALLLAHIYGKQGDKQSKKAYIIRAAEFGNKDARRIMFVKVGQTNFQLVADWMENERLFGFVVSEFLGF